MTDIKNNLYKTARADVKGYPTGNMLAVCIWLYLQQISDRYGGVLDAKLMP